MQLEDPGRIRIPLLGPESALGRTHPEFMNSTHLSHVLKTRGSMIRLVIRGSPLARSRFAEFRLLNS